MCIRDRDWKELLVCQGFDIAKLNLGDTDYSSLNKLAGPFWEESVLPDSCVWELADPAPESSCSLLCPLTMGIIQIRFMFK